MYLVVGSLLCCLALLFHQIVRHQPGGESPGLALSVLALVSPAFLTCPFVLSSLGVVFASSCGFVRGGGVRSPGEFGVLVHPSLGKSVKFVCVVFVNGGPALYSAGFTSPKT